MFPSPSQLTHLRRALALASSALEAGDAPFGSVLVSDTGGTVLREARNRIRTTGDATRHPELELAQWAATNLAPGVRAAATVYTSGEHCAMCAAAHAWAGLGRIVYVASMEQLVAWMAEFAREKDDDGAGGSLPVAPLSVQSVAPGVRIEGPVAELEDEVKALHRRYAGLAA